MVSTRDQVILEADFCLRRSGGGGVIAGTLVGQGCKVVVLEAGRSYNEADFNQLELWAYHNLYYRGGPTPTADGTDSMLVGATLGGGMIVNWTNCVCTKPWVREEWVGKFGLEGLDTQGFDRHLDAVLKRILANDRCSDCNGPHLRRKEGCEKLGYSFKRIVRNTDPATYDPASAGYLGFGMRGDCAILAIHSRGTEEPSA